MDRRDRFEELFRERLHNWECEPDSEQWKTLAGFLPLRPTRFSTRSIRRTAAIVTLLLLVGGGLLYDRLIPETTTEIVRNRIQPFIVDHIQIPQLTGTVTTDQIASLFSLENLSTQLEKRFQRINIKVKKLKYYL